MLFKPFPDGNLFFTFVFKANNEEKLKQILFIIFLYPKNFATADTFPM